MKEKEDWVERYFEKRLSPGEEETFKAYLRSDPEFAAEVAFQEDLKAAIAQGQRADLKVRLKNYEQAEFSGSRYRYWYTAAAVVLLFCTGGFYFFYAQRSGAENLYQAYYQTYPNTILPTVRGGSGHDTRAQAFYDYDNGDYASSLKLFTEMYEREQSDYALFYLSMSLMELGRYQDAVRSLDEFDLLQDSGFTPFVKWYKALAYLRTNQKKKAVNLLESLSKTANVQQEMAQKLLSDLK